ncbi:CoA transferase [Caballeronia sp. 15711]|uniref:CoA transferase n=1 Tax=Caballeronia sp. 15711 TaxID=3391029 RepID=UPI0039E36DDA
MTVRNPFVDLIDAAGYQHSDVGAVQILGDDPVLPLRYRIASTGAAAIAANGLAAAELWKLKGGAPQTIEVDARHAAVAMRSSHYLQVDGARPPNAEKLTGFYPTQDGRWVYLHCNFSNLSARNCAVLAADDTRESVAKRVREWEGAELEEAIFAGGGCGALVRSESEWDALPQKRAVEALPLLEIVKIGESEREPLPEGARPLSGIRVLDLTRVLAGPTCARTLAEHGADVLRVNRVDLPDSGLSDLDTGIGKLATYIDFRNAQQATTLRDLIRDADVFSQAYRPGALAAYGMSPEKLATLRPGIVVVSLSAWGHTGPWKDRRGYDTVVQAANGMAWQDSERPQFLPVSAQDYLAGYLMSFGAMVALDRRTREGGTWLVRVSLARVGHWIRQQGLLRNHEYVDQPNELERLELERILMSTESFAGRLTHLGPIARLSATPGRWDRPPVAHGTHAPEWPTRRTRG